MADFDFLVAPPIQGIDQGNSELCWLAATAVMFQWREGRVVSLQDAANALGVEFVAIYARDGVLPFPDIPLWQQRGGFESQGQQCFDANGWLGLLQQYGPLIALVSANATNTVDHAVVVAGISGDGSPAGTNLTIADGDGGIVRDVDLGTFTTMFEIPANINQLFSVMYFPA
jgi:hypothetical protein